MRGRVKRMQELIARSLLNPSVVLSLPHDVRAALADLSAELMELNERIETLEKVNDGKKTHRTL